MVVYLKNTGTSVYINYYTQTSERIEEIGYTSDDSRRSDVDTAHVALKPVRNVTRRAAQPTADVDDVLAGLDRELVRELHGCAKAPGMEVVDGGQILERQVLQGLRRLVQRGHDQAVDIALRPMVRYGSGAYHFCLLLARVLATKGAVQDVLS